MSSKSRYIRTFSIKMSSGTSQMESVSQDQKRCSSLSFWIKYGLISLASIIHILFILRCKDNIIFLNYQENVKKLIPNQSFPFPLQSQSDTWRCPSPCAYSQSMRNLCWLSLCGDCSSCRRIRMRTSAG